MSKYKRLHYLPLTIFILLPGTFIGISITSTLLNHDFPVFPNVSDAGANPPESCFFSFFLNITSALVALLIYVRSKMIKEYFRKKAKLLKAHKALRLNSVSTMVGWLGCAGFSLAANFQESNVVYVHYLGLILAFWSLSIYFILQTVVSVWSGRDLTSQYLIWIRGPLAVGVLLATIFNQVTALIASTNFSGDIKDMVNWDNTMGGWNWHLLSSISEWIIIFIYATFILSFTAEFKRLIIHSPEITSSSTSELDSAIYRHKFSPIQS